MIKVNINVNNKVSKLPFPKLMITESNTIVLMQERSMGVVLSEGACSYKLGYYSDTWDMNAFKDFNDYITLQNDEG